jgi:hypothetical protein
MPVKCLKCGSEQIAPKTIPGDATHPPKTLVVCLNCGNEWDPKDYDRLQKQAAQQAQERKDAAWKAAFYAAVEANDITKATALMNESAELKSKFTNPKDAYDYLKKRDKTTTYIAIGIFVVFIIIVIYVMSGNF